MKALGPLMGLCGGQGQSWGTLTIFKKLEEKEENISSHRCNCKDIKLDPSRISDPAIMGQLLGEASPFLPFSARAIKNTYKL